MSEPIVRHICSTCEHNNVCKHKEIYEREIEKIPDLKIKVATLYVECQYFTPVVITKREPWQPFNNR